MIVVLLENRLKMSNIDQYHLATQIHRCLTKVQYETDQVVILENPIVAVGLFCIKIKPIQHRPSFEVCQLHSSSLFYHNSINVKLVHFFDFLWLVGIFRFSLEMNFSHLFLYADSWKELEASAQQVALTFGTRKCE